MPEKKEKKPAAKKSSTAASSKSKPKPDAPNTASSKAKQMYGGNQAVPLDKRPNGGRLS